MFGTDQRITSGPAATTAAFRGRIHGCTRTIRANVQFSSCTAGAVHTWHMAPFAHGLGLPWLSDHEQTLNCSRAADNCPEPLSRRPKVTVPRGGRPTFRANAGLSVVIPGGSAVWQWKIFASDGGTTVTIGRGDRPVPYIDLAEARSPHSPVARADPPYAASRRRSSGSRRI